MGRKKASDENQLAGTAYSKDDSKDELIPQKSAEN